MVLGGVAMWFVIWGSIVIQIRISIQMSMRILIGILFGVFDFSFYHTSNMKYDANMSPVGVSMVHLAWISMRLNIILDMACPIDSKAKFCKHIDPNVNMM